MSAGASIEEIRSAVDIVAIVGEVVSLQRRGHNYFGCCPFHQEKSPSFSISPDKQLFHCFGCKAGGDVIKFYQLYHRVEFQQALEDLAKRAGLEVSKRRKNPENDEALEILELTCRFFEEKLLEKEGEVFRQYLEGRSVPAYLWKEFRLGCHPGGYHDLADHLKSKSFSLELAAKLGLVSRKQDGGWVDRFRGRLMFSIADERGKIKGFGGRSLGKDEPKYINSPASQLFDKKKLLYGMHLATEELRRREFAVLVEGYLDVIALHEYGVKNAVGSMGTALTQDQIRKLKRWTHRVVSLYDGDKAGVAATERNLERFISEGLEVKIVVMPGAKDPDSYLHESPGSFEDKKNSLKAVFKKSQTAVDYLIQHQVLSETDSVKRAKAARQLMDQMDRVPDPIERQMMKNEVSRKLNLPKMSQSEPMPSMAINAPKRSPSMASNWDRELLKFMVLWGKGRDFALAEVIPYLSFRSKWSKLIKQLAEQGLGCSEISELHWLSDADEAQQAEIREWILVNPEQGFQQDLDQVWKDLNIRIRNSYMQEHSERIQRLLEDAESRNDAEEVRRLLAEKRDLVEMVKNLMSF